MRALYRSSRGSAPADIAPDHDTQDSLDPSGLGLWDESEQVGCSVLTPWTSFHSQPFQFDFWTMHGSLFPYFGMIWYVQISHRMPLLQFLHFPYLQLLTLQYRRLWTSLLHRSNTPKVGHTQRLFGQLWLQGRFRRHSRSCNWRPTRVRTLRRLYSAVGLGGRTHQIIATSSLLQYH